MPRLAPVEELFKGRHFDQQIIVLCIRWYLSYKLSYRDLVAMMDERGIPLAHTMILRWVQHYSLEFEKRWKRYARSVGGSWRCDETYIKVKGTWVYLYRAVDKAGQTVDFYLSRKRDVNAAKAFLRKAMREQRTPTKITLDAYAASHRAVADLKKTGELPRRVRVRSSKYLNNIIEQDHLRVKHRLRPMLGLKSFRTAAVVIGGIELAEKIKKGQFKMGELGGTRASMAEVVASSPGCVIGVPVNRHGKPERLPPIFEFAPEPSYSCCPRQRYNTGQEAPMCVFQKFSFGSIRIDGTTYEHDVVIDGGQIRKRKKKPSKKFRAAFGHTPLSVEEEIPWKCRRLVIGTGTGALPVMEEVKQEAKRRKIKLVVLPTAKAIEVLKKEPDKANAILHVTC